jgi:hypothetical protein
MSRSLAARLNMSPEAAAATGGNASSSVEAWWVESSADEEEVTGTYDVFINHHEVDTLDTWHTVARAPAARLTAAP